MTFDFTDNSDKVLGEMSQKIDAVLEAIGIHLEGEAKEELENSPRRIDTGLLRNSITHAISGEPPAINMYQGDNASQYRTGGGVPSGVYRGNAPDDPDTKKAVYIGTNVSYGIYIHEGTQKITANRFLKNACVRNETQIKDKLESVMKEN